MKEICEGSGDGLVRWDITHVRLAADWTAPPCDTGTVAEPQCMCRFNDDAGFFDTEAP